MLSKTTQIVAFAAAFGLLCALAAAEWGWSPNFDRPLNGDDEVTLLQERVLQRHLSKSGAGTKSPVDPETKVPNVCEDMTAKASSFNVATFDDFREPQPTLGAPSAKVEPPVDDVEVDIGIATPASEKNYTTILRYALDFVIVLVLLDGCRCWWSGAEKVESDEAQCSGSDEAFQQMMRAATMGDQAGAREMLRQGAAVTETDFWGCTALHAAAKGGCAQLIAELIDLGAQVDAIDAWDETPLHIASRAGHVDVCEELLRCGANMDALNAQSFTPLVVAASSERSAVTFMLLQKGAGAGELVGPDLPPLLRELLFDQKEVSLEEAETHGEAELDEDVRLWPTDEDWEEHMRESIDSDFVA